ncbi:hypothetical protein MHB77_32590 [Paenibacillus sp. FSL K6-3166]|uniref:hypothetical protein n=1 Tax=unclassified Paenibacillus TaxID=185978 RepID=UPI000BA10DDA|nr:hypothetical protein [Paenibacillus sp. VTT E-133291]OZQ84665.1 hypothetical protein CA598_23000 [Paenibacillus sp. VTT E-133291]
MSEVKPVTIPREVADAIEGLRLRMYTNDMLALLAFRENGRIGRRTDDAQAIRDYAQVNVDDFMTALVFGYERELEPEEAVVVLYEGLRESERIANGMYGGDPYQYAFAARTVQRVLNALRIVIPGINDEKGGAA